MAWRAAVDVFRNGHFNVIGQVFGAWVFTAWSYLISWGVRFSLIYAATKFVVIVGCAIAAGRLLRTLGAMVGWRPSPWRARVLATTVLLVTLQVHVPWGSDPVGSFPLFGYLPAAIGLLAMDVALRAMQRDDSGSVARGGRRAVRSDPVLRAERRRSRRAGAGGRAADDPVALAARRSDGSPRSPGRRR